MDFQTPEDILGKGRKDLADFKKYLLPTVVILFFLIVLKGMIYSVGPDEEGIIQRFGKYIQTTTPGLHFKLPLGIDRVTKLRVKRIYKEEFGFRTLRPGIKTQYSEQGYQDESLMLTGDLNILDVRWVVQYRIKDPVKFLFATRDPQNNVRAISEVIIRRLVGDARVDEVLSTRREEIDQLAQHNIQQILDNYQTGIRVVTVKLLDVNPPQEVKAAFNEVNEAKQEKERLINQAWEAYNKVIPKAKGEAEGTISKAEGYSMDKINRAQGDTERFLEVLQEYKKAPQITKKRLYLDTMQEILPKAKQKYIIDSKQSSILPLLNLNQNGGNK